MNDITREASAETAPAPASHKECAHCGQLKPLADFLRRTGRRSGATGRRGTCRACRQQQKQEQAETPVSAAKAGAPGLAEALASATEASAPGLASAAGAPSRRAKTLAGAADAAAGPAETPASAAKEAPAAETAEAVAVSAESAEAEAPVPAGEPVLAAEAAPAAAGKRGRRRRRKSAKGAVIEAAGPAQLPPHNAGEAAHALPLDAVREHASAPANAAALSLDSADAHALAPAPALAAEPGLTPPDTADAEEPGAAPKRKRRRRRGRRGKKAAAPAAAETAAEPRPKRRRVPQPAPVLPPKPPGPHEATLRPTASGVIRMRGRTDKGRRWVQETDLETAVTLVREHAAVVVNRSTIRRVYSNKMFRSYILTRDNYTCYFCGEYGDTIDHLLPRAKGGHTTPVNCVCACSLCNQSKADKDVDVFMMSMEQ